MATPRIDIIAVGKLKERFWVDACSEYLKRLAPFAEVQVKEVDDISLVHVGSRERVLEKEAERIRKVCAAESYRIMLDRQGKLHSSEQIAELLERKLLEGSQHHLSFIIGGSEGLLPALAQEGNERLSFGALTLPHNLARVVLLEQLYRAFKIIRHEPYHK